MTPNEVARAWAENPPSDRHLEDALEVLSKSPNYTEIVNEIFFLESEDGEDFT